MKREEEKSQPNKRERGAQATAEMLKKKKVKEENKKEEEWTFRNSKVILRPSSKRENEKGNREN